ncbi:MAG: hypothetical protein Q4C91_05365 [Eubacteriales bacterium]|nr:hypothetical protein [Eubacteriales bacterium]
MDRRQWIVLLLLGLLLTVIAMPTSRKKDEKTAELFESSGEDALAEKTELEAKLEALLGSAEGVGKVQVLLMTGQDTETKGFYASGDTKVTGVLISAEGADDPVTVQNIQQAVMALFQVEAHKIKVMKMK